MPRVNQNKIIFRHENDFCFCFFFFVKKRKKSSQFSNFPPMREKTKLVKKTKRPNPCIELSFSTNPD